VIGEFRWLGAAGLANHPPLCNAEDAMREYVWLECTGCGNRNYRTQKETRATEKLELKKYCRKERKHVVHKESRKK